MASAIMRLALMVMPSGFSHKTFTPASMQSMLAV
jgi:hypothetical protein